MSYVVALSSGCTQKVCEVRDKILARNNTASRLRFRIACDGQMPVVRSTEWYMKDTRAAFSVHHLRKTTNQEACVPVHHCQKNVGIVVEFFI